MSAATIRPVAPEVLTGHGRPGDFRHQAACRSVDPEVFFPVAETGPELTREVGIAKRVCAGCPVRSECLTWALAHQPHGIAGGLTETERAQLRSGRRTSTKKARRPVAGTPQEVAAAGRAAIGQGRDPGEVAAEFGVSERTAQRWAQEIARTCSTAPGLAGVRS